MLQARESTDRGRRYLATTRTGGRLIVTVLDRDLEGAGLANAIWTSLRLRDDSAAGAFNMRRALDHAALVAYAAQAAGAPVPRLLLASEIGPDSVLMAYELIEGTRFSNLRRGHRRRPRARLARDAHPAREPDQPPVPHGRRTCCAPRTAPSG